MNRLSKDIIGSSKDTSRKPLKVQQSQSKPQVSSSPSVEAKPLPEKVDHHNTLRKSSKAEEIILKDPFVQAGRTIEDQGPLSKGKSPSKSRVPSEVERSSQLVQTEREESPLGTLYISQNPIPVVDSHPALLIGLSGVSSSGKTTISHLLRLVLPSSSPVFILHQDDFFIEKRLLVPSSNGELSADSPDAVDFTALIRMLQYAKRKGALPPTFHSVQMEKDERALAISKVNPKVLDDLKDFVSRSEHFKDGRSVGIIDGFLLYQDPAIRQLLDVKVLLRASKENSRMRRFQKPDYTGPDVGGKFFWRTQEYYDKVVWRNYSQEHEPLFEEGDVEGQPLENVCDSLRISVQPELDMNVEDTLKWAVQSIVDSAGNLKFQETQKIETRMLPAPEYEICDCHSGWLAILWRTLNDLL